MDINKLPIEISLMRAKREILQAINQIGNSYNLPSSITTMLVDEIVKESSLNTYTTILSNYNIELPEGVITDDSKTSNKPKIKEVKKPELFNNDVNMKAETV